MWIVWGTTTRCDVLGIAADRCPVCGQVRAGRIVQQFEVGHLYFVSLGRGSLRSTSWQCETCSTEVPVTLDSYDDWIAPWPARRLSIEELLARTNSRLQKKIQDRESLATLARREDLEGDAAARLAMSRLEDCPGPSDRIHEFREKLLSWHRLDMESRSALLGEIDGFIGRQRDSLQRVQRVQTFARGVLDQCPQGAGCFPAIVTGILLIIILAFVISQNKKVADVVFFTVAVLSIAAYFFFYRFAYRRWFKKLLREAAASQIDPAEVLAALQRLWEQGPDTSINADKQRSREELYKNLHMLEKLVWDWRIDQIAGGTESPGDGIMRSSTAITSKSPDCNIQPADDK